MIKRLCAAALISGLAITFAANADNTEYVSIITKQLDDVEARMKPVMEGADRQMLRVSEIVSLTDNDRNGVYYLTELEPNTGYLIVGVCDGDCDDLDLQIDDPSGDTLDTDIEDDDAPVLEFTTDADSFYYKLLVDMVSCDTENCFYGVGVFKTDAATPTVTENVDYEDVVDRQLAEVNRRILEKANDEGREVTQILEHKSMLMTDAEDVIELEDVNGFERYVIVGVCDQDCDAMGLKLVSKFASVDPDLVEETTERTDVPTIEFKARPLSDHEVTVSMNECSNEPCFYGLAVYEVGDQE